MSYHKNKNRAIPISENNCGLLEMLDDQCIHDTSQKYNATFGHTYNAFYNHINTLKIFVVQKMYDGKLATCSAAASLAENIEEQSAASASAYCVARQKISTLAIRDLIRVVSKKL